MPTKNNEFTFLLKSASSDGSFAGYASVFGVVDSQNDVIMQGAFARTLRKRKGEIKLLWQHRADKPIGVFTQIREDTRGLYVEGRILLDLQHGGEAYSLLKNGAINGLSIGYTVVDADYNGENNIRLITDLDLWEISLVTFPANAEAVVISVKNKKPGKREAKKKPGDSLLLDSINKAIMVLGG